MRVAATLGIPFREITLEEYKKEVVEDMLANYARGVTPNRTCSNVHIGALRTGACGGSRHNSDWSLCSVRKEGSTYRLVKGFHRGPVIFCAG